MVTIMLWKREGKHWIRIAKCETSKEPLEACWMTWYKSVDLFQRPEDWKLCCTTTDFYTTTSGNQRWILFQRNEGREE